MGPAVPKRKAKDRKVRMATSQAQEEAAEHSQALELIKQEMELTRKNVDAKIDAERRKHSGKLLR